MICKGCQQFNLDWSIDLLYVGVNSREVESKPFLPSWPKIQLFTFSWHHNAVSKCFWYRAEKILNARLFVNWNNIHEIFCGGGSGIKDGEECMRICGIISQSYVIHNILDSPEIWSIVRNPDWHTFIWVANAFKMLEAIGKILVQNLYIRDTAEMLPHQIATLVSFRLSTAFSSAI